VNEEGSRGRVSSNNIFRDLAEFWGWINHWWSCDQLVLVGSGNGVVVRVWFWIVKGGDW
jgi:hypothetical protein